MTVTFRIPEKEADGTPAINIARAIIARIFFYSAYL